MQEELRWDESSIIGMSRWLKNCDLLIKDFEKSVDPVDPQDLESIPLDKNILKTIDKVSLFFHFILDYRLFYKNLEFPQCNICTNYLLQQTQKL